MIVAMVAALAVVVEADPLTTRIADANAGAQALQGPLDGAWALRNGAGRVLYVFQISDVLGSELPAKGAWRDAAGVIGHAAFKRVGRRRLKIRLDDASLAMTLTRTGGVWLGVLAGRGEVTLSHSLASDGPPV